MDLDLLMRGLGWASAINIAILLLWFVSFMIARNWLYNFHSRWFSIPNEKFDTIHYCLMGVFELLILAFFIAPYLALRIIT
jgi:hypothetical protein